MNSHDNNEPSAPSFSALAYLPEGADQRRPRTIVDTDRTWIVSALASGSSHIAAEGETTSMLGTAPPKPALAANVDAQSDRPHHLRHLDAGLHSPRPPRRSRLARHHEGRRLRLQAVCSGFVFAVATADKFLRSGSHKRALVIGANVLAPARLERPHHLRAVRR